MAATPGRGWCRRKMWSDAHRCVQSAPPGPSANHSPWPSPPREAAGGWPRSDLLKACGREKAEGKEEGEKRGEWGKEEGRRRNEGERETGKGGWENGRE